MKIEIAEIWIDALESGEYEQTKGLLKRKDSYCCLGILCQISGLGEFKQLMGDKFFSYILTNGETCSLAALPNEILEWAGMSDMYGNFDKSDGFSTLSILNDSGKTFREIAEIIRDNYQTL